MFSTIDKTMHYFDDVIRSCLKFPSQSDKQMSVFQGVAFKCID